VPVLRFRPVTNITTYDDVVAWLRDHSGHTVTLEIGQTDPNRDDYDAIFGIVHGLKLGDVVFGTDLGPPDEDDPEQTVWIVFLPDFGERSKLIFDHRRFVKAIGDSGAFKVWLHDTYFAFAA
jgi:hypothetical protein